MRFAKLLFAGIIAAIALIAGVFAAAVVAVTALAVLITRHFLRRPPTSTVQPRVTTRTPTQRMNADGAIDVTATEVPADPSHR